MKNRLILKRLINILLIGWLFIVLSLILVIFFPVIAKNAAIFTLIVAFFMLLNGFGLSLTIDSDDLFWESIDKVNKAHALWEERRKEAIAYKNVYLNLIIDKNTISDKTLKKLVEEEKDKI